MDLGELSEEGMPYIDLREHAEGHVMLETVRKNLEMFSKSEIERAELARAVQQQIWHPMDEHVKSIVSQQSLKNIPISTTDVTNTKTLFEPSVARMSGQHAKGPRDFW